MSDFLRKLWRKCGGTAAIEFAFALPILLVMFLGLYELTQGLIVYMKVIDVADTVSDLVAQQSTIASSDITNYYTAGQLVMTPSAPGGLQLAVASVVFNSPTSSFVTGCVAGQSCVAWQVTRGGAAKMTDALAAAAGLGTTGAGSTDSVIEAQATYTYQSILKYVLPKGITISARVFSRPRVVFSIPCTAPCN